MKRTLKDFWIADEPPSKKNCNNEEIIDFNDDSKYDNSNNSNKFEGMLDDSHDV